MNFDYINPHKLIKNPWNSNKVDRDNFNKLKKSLQTFGNFKPIIVREIDAGFQILGGFHRVEAAKELGIKEVPYFNLGRVDDDYAKQVTLVDNTRYGKDDADLLEALLDGIEDLSALEEILPVDTIEIPEVDMEVEETESFAEEERKDRTEIKLKFDDPDKYDEILDLLLKVIRDNDYSYKEQTNNLADAIYHLLVLEKK